MLLASEDIKQKQNERTQSLLAHTQQGHSVVAAMLDEDPAQCLQDLIFKLPSNTAYNL